MNTKSKFKAFFDSKQIDAQYIEKYEENIDFFNDLLLTGHKEDIEFVIPIKMYKYADSLFNTGHYKKALTVLYEIDIHLDKIKGQSKWYNTYLEGVTFLKGICLGRLKMYKESNVEFKKLLKKNPTNDNFIDWYKSNKMKMISRFFEMVMVVGIAYYLIVIFAGFLGHKIENIIIKDLGIAIAFLAFVTSYIWKKIINKKEIKLKTTAT